MRSTSGIGIDSGAPNMSPADTCLGIWSTVLAVNTLVVPRAWSSTRPCTRLARLWALGLPRYTPTASRPCSATTAGRRSAMTAKASSQSTSRHVAASPRPVRTNGPPEPVGIVLELGERRALRAEEAVGEHVVAVAAGEHELVALEVELEAAGGLAQRTGPVRDAATHGPTLGHGRTSPFP